MYVHACVEHSPLKFHGQQVPRAIHVTSCPMKYTLSKQQGMAFLGGASDSHILLARSYQQVNLLLLPICIVYPF